MREREQQRILAGMAAHGYSGRAVDDQWVCDVGGECDAEVQSETQPGCPTCGEPMLRVLVVGDPIVLSEW